MEHCRGEPGSALSSEYAPDSARAARSSTSQGSVEPLCARSKGVNREVPKGKAVSDHGIFLFDEGQKKWRTGKRAGFTSSRPPPP